MNYKKIVQVTAVVIVIVFAAGITLSGDTVQVGWLRFLSAAVLVATAVLAIYETWFWHTGPAQRIRSVAPSVRGTWRGTLSSQWINPATGKRYPDKTVYLVVRQTASNIRISLHTDESSSSSKVAAITRDRDDAWIIDYIYFNEPQLHLREQSPMHHGGGSLKVSGRPAQRIDGSYWTDRDSKGALSFDTRRDDLSDDFEMAQNLFS